VDKLLTLVKLAWPLSGVSIVFDGWMDLAVYLLIDFMVSSKCGPIFLKVVDALGKYKDATYMAELFVKVSGEVGVDSYVQIIINNALVCKATNFIVETKYL
jgi:hypothetical protein